MRPRYFFACMVLFFFVGIPHLNAMLQWSQDRHFSIQVYRFWIEATRSEWLYYHRDWWIAIVGGVVLAIVLFTGGRGKQ